MSLCDEETIEKLNGWFIPCFYDDMLTFGSADPRFSPLPDSASPELRKTWQVVFDTLKGSGRPLPGSGIKADRPPRPGIQMYVVDLDGNIEYIDEIMGDDPKGLVLRTLQKYIERPGAAHGDKVATYKSGPRQPVPPGGVKMRIVTRYVQPPTHDDLVALDPQGARFPTFFSMPAILSPLRDWEVLSADQVTALLPPVPVPGLRYRVPSEVGASLFRHFTTAFSALKVVEVKVKSMDLEGEVVPSRDPSRTVVLLHGSFRNSDPGMHGDMPLPNYVEADVVGVLEYDATTRKLLDLRVATRDARECSPDGFALPFRAIAYSVTE